MRLELQQPGMARRRENTTRYVSYQRRMQWRVEWRFPAAGDLSVSDIRRVHCMFEPFQPEDRVSSGRTGMGFMFGLHPGSRARNKVKRGFHPDTGALDGSAVCASDD